MSSSVIDDHLHVKLTSCLHRPPVHSFVAHWQRSKAEALKFVTSGHLWKTVKDSWSSIDLFEVHGREIVLILQRHIGRTVGVVDPLSLWQRNTKGCEVASGQPARRTASSLLGFKRSGNDYDYEHGVWGIHPQWGWQKQGSKRNQLWLLLRQVRTGRQSRRIQSSWRFIIIDESAANHQKSAGVYKVWRGCSQDCHQKK